MKKVIDIIHEGTPNGWSLAGFFPSNESGNGKSWRAVIGTHAEITFFIDKKNVYQIWYQYFTVVKPLKINVFLDGRRVDHRENKIYVTDYGYIISDLAVGKHTLQFNFDHVRSANTAGGDQRPIPVAFTEMRFEQKIQPQGLLGSSTLGISIAIFICIGLLVMLFFYLFKFDLSKTNYHPK